MRAMWLPLSRGPLQNVAAVPTFTLLIGVLSCGKGVSVEPRGHARDAAGGDTPGDVSGPDGARADAGTGPDLALPGVGGAGMGGVAPTPDAGRGMSGGAGGLLTGGMPGGGQAGGGTAGGGGAGGAGGAGGGMAGRGGAGKGTAGGGMAGGGGGGGAGGGTAGRGGASGGGAGGETAGGGGAGGGVAGRGGAGAGGLAGGGGTMGGAGAGGAASGGAGPGAAGSGGGGWGGGRDGQSTGGAGSAQSWWSIAGAVSSAPAATRESSSPVIDVYAVGEGPDFHIKHATVSGSAPSAWDSSVIKPPGKPVGPLAAAVHDGRRELVVISGGTVYYGYDEPNHPWGTWTSLGAGNVTAGVSVCLFDSNRLDVFARGPGPEHLVWHSIVNGTTPWTYWEPNAGGPPGGLRGTPAALSRRLLEVDLVGQSDADGRLYHTHYDFDRNWTPWTALGDLTDMAELSPALSSVDPERLDIWTRGPDGQLLHTSFVGAIAPGAADVRWESLTVTPSGALTPGYGLSVLPGLDQRLNFFVRLASTSEIIRLVETPVSPGGAP